MELNREKSGQEQDEPSVLGSVHISTSNVLSYSLVTGAAMLAFFFAFQAALISYFSNLYSTFAAVSIAFRPYQVPIGKICLTMLCVVMIMFTVWSLQMVHMTIDYITHIIKSGSTLEARISNLDNGIFSAILTNHERRSRHSKLSVWTTVVCWAISFLWIFIGILVWAPRP